MGFRICPDVEATNEMMDINAIKESDGFFMNVHPENCAP
jgi:hypothetical protein